MEMAGILLVETDNLGIVQIQMVLRHFILRGLTAFKWAYSILGFLKKTPKDPNIPLQMVYGTTSKTV